MAKPIEYVVELNKEEAEGIPRGHTKSKAKSCPRQIHEGSNELQAEINLTEAV